ncbi:hypothetical protein [Methylobacterium segetis]|uniref:hypothetical protein n=1 Tax=Methylobacterium segetis TaxID=2488750 RepID=UPI00104A1BE6|nr:hypothetical protein [Methylobacterium segetis]
MSSAVLQGGRPRERVYGLDDELPDPELAPPVTGSERALSSSVMAASMQSFNVSRGPHRTWIFASPIFM